MTIFFKLLYAYKSVTSFSVVLSLMIVIFCVTLSLLDVVISVIRLVARYLHVFSTFWASCVWHFRCP